MKRPPSIPTLAPAEVVEPTAEGPLPEGRETPEGVGPSASPEQPEDPDGENPQSLGPRPQDASPDPLNIEEVRETVRKAYAEDPLYSRALRSFEAKDGCYFLYFFATSSTLNERKITGGTPQYPQKGCNRGCARDAGAPSGLLPDLMREKGGFARLCQGAESPGYNRAAQAPLKDHPEW